MELEDLREQIKREAERIATAFDAQDWKQTTGFRNFYYVGTVCQFSDERTRITWNLSPEDGQLVAVEIGDYGEGCCVFFDTSSGQEPEWKLYREPRFHNVMARGLFRLGFEPNPVFAELESSLTAHEKLDLRERMPREFWPKRWGDEEAAPPASE